MVNHMRHTRSQTAQRRSHHALTARAVVACPDCKMPKMSHAVCTHCGKYKGRVVIDVAKVAAKRQAKSKARAKEGAKS